MKQLCKYLISFLALFVSVPNILAQGSSGQELSTVVRKQLGQVRGATARYHNLSAALADGYVNIDLFVPGQGFHYLNPGLLDDVFEVDRPEALIYARNPQGNQIRLVAVEYLAPADLLPEPPEGFPGESDMWHLEEDVNLWALHAWIWLSNPNGVFAGVNPRVQ